MGVASETVDAPGELGGALARARDAKGPSLIVVRTDPKAVEYYLSWVAR